MHGTAVAHGVVFVLHVYRAVLGVGHAIEFVVPDGDVLVRAHRAGVVCSQAAVGFPSAVAGVVVAVAQQDVTTEVPGGAYSGMWSSFWCLLDRCSRYYLR